MSWDVAYISPRAVIINRHGIKIMKQAILRKSKAIIVSSYEPGDRIKITCGLFKDVEAIFQKREGKHLYFFWEQTGLQIIITLD